MKKLLLYCVMFFIAISCNKNISKNNKEINHIQNKSWTEIVENAKGTTVYMAMWGGNNQYNSYIDNIVSKQVKEKYNINLIRIPLEDAKIAVNKLIVEKVSNKHYGSIDILWENGENFFELKNNKALFGNILDIIPNKDIIKKSAQQLDFGEQINGFEIPWGEAQFTFQYNSKYTDIPFSNLDELKSWVRQNPGKFTYPALPDFYGSAFVRNLAIHMIGENKINNMTDEELKKALVPLWDYLNGLEPYLWREGKTYPSDQAFLDNLYVNNEIFITMGYNPNRAFSKIKNNLFPSSTKTFILDKGTLFNNHYLTIPWNSSNPEGALVVINYLVSPESQVLKSDPNNWGDMTILDTSKLEHNEQNKLKSFTIDESILDTETLSKHRVFELKAEKAILIENEWDKYVNKN